MTEAPTQLDPFEGQPVLSVGIEIPGAAGGLREAGEFTLDEAALDEAHDNGDHASGLVPGCPQCDHEVALEAAENEPPKGTPASIEDRP